MKVKQLKKCSSLVFPYETLVCEGELLVIFIPSLFSINLQLQQLYVITHQSSVIVQPLLLLMLLQLVHLVELLLQELPQQALRHVAPLQ